MNLALILLAAGDSRRFNGNKLLHEFHGKPMYRYIVEEVSKLPEPFFERKLVVTQYQEIMDTIKNHGYEVVINRESTLGISHSIKLGLEGLKQEDMDVCFAVCDQPYLKVETIRSLIKGWKSSGKGMGCLRNQGNLGNPCVFSARYRKDLLKLTGDVGGKRVILQHMEDLYTYEVMKGQELEDIDVQKNIDNVEVKDGKKDT